MERMALVYRLRTGSRDEYIEAHREIWPEITEGLKEAGCHEMNIFLRDDLLFLYALIDNIEVFNATRAKDPHFQKWNDWMSELLVAPFDDEEPGPFASLTEMWRFDVDNA